MSTVHRRRDPEGVVLSEESQDVGRRVVRLRALHLVVAFEDGVIDTQRLGSKHHVSNERNERTDDQGDRARGLNDGGKLPSERLTTSGR